MKSQKFISLLILAVISLSAFAQTNTKYSYSVDLTQVKEDKLEVTLITPELGKNKVMFRMPRIVPGTYDVYDFGRFISDVKAFDKNGNALIVTQSNPNAWEISNAEQLSKISYWVQDTWDTDIDSNFIFEPGGSNIERDSNFVINTFCFFGYLDELKSAPYEISVTKPAGFYGASSMQPQHISPTKDLFITDSYYNLADAPIMYCVPDTTVLDVAGTDVMVSVYSPNKMMTSAFIADNMKEILFGIRDYLGGKLPVDNYVFLFYFMDGWSKSGGFGALEHSYSSFYSLPESDPADMQQTIRDVSAHEFLHIVTPLNIHSEEIGYFDYDHPIMSRHLWLYEGMTEYSAHLSQVKAGLITLGEFIETMNGKMRNNSDSYNDTLPFTVMSLGALDIYKEQYGNVYEKGALIGMCLDLKLRSLSDGKYGIQNMLADLSKEYGKNVSFKDDELFGEIEKLTYPEIGEYLRTYVSGKKPLPYKEYLAYAGISYNDQMLESSFTLGNVPFSFNPQTARLVVESTDDLNEFGRKLGYVKGDELVAINGVELRPQNIQQTFDDLFNNMQAGDKIKIEVMRQVKGKEKKVTLKAKMVLIEKILRHSITLDENATPQQMKIRMAWLGDYKTE